MAKPVEFQVGQVWTYKNAISASSRVIVGKIDVAPNGEKIVSILVTEAPLPNSTIPNPIFGHAPFSEAALRDCVVDREADVAVPSEFYEGYKVWRSAFDEGRAGYFTISVDEATRAIAAATSQSAPK